MRTLALIAAISWAGLWFTPDKQGQRLFMQGEFAAAAATFHDPLWQGAAWYRYGDFARAARAFARWHGVPGGSRRCRTARSQ